MAASKEEKEQLYSRMMWVHFIAIGGSAMHDLAIALHKEGHRVSGSDDAFFDPSRSRLEAYGLLPEEEGWHPERIREGMDRVILGMHAKKDNPELLRARELNIPIQSFPEFVAEQSQGKERTVIAGSHGKTTITAMILHALKKNGEEADRLVGAQLEGYDGAVRLSEGAKRIVIEGDEYLSSPIDPRPKFLWYEPHLALISGIAWDHVNVFPEFEDYLDAFRRLIASVQEGGKLFYCEEDPELVDLVRKEAGHLESVPYGTHPHRTEEAGSKLLTDGGGVLVPIFGSHNMQNLEGALKVCQELGLHDEAFYEAMQDFRGAALRLEPLFEAGKQLAYRDYAHAPSKVAATVKALKEKHPEDPLLAVLELHTYSSLDPNFIDHYAGSMDEAEEAFLFYDPKAAAKKGLGALDPEMLRNAFKRPDLEVYTDMEELEGAIRSKLKGAEREKLLFMSSGAFGEKDLKQVAQRLLS